MSQLSKALRNSYFDQNFNTISLNSYGRKMQNMINTQITLYYLNGVLIMKHVPKLNMYSIKCILENDLRTQNI